MKFPRIIWGAVAERINALTVEVHNLRLANRLLHRALSRATREVVEHQRQMAESQAKRAQL